MPKSWKYVCVAVALLAAVGLAGCSTFSKPPAMSEDAIRSNLVGKTWTLVRVIARDIKSEVPLTLKFGANDTMEGFGGCNAFTAPYTLDKDKLEFGPIETAHQSCGPAADEREFAFLTILPKVRRVHVEGSELILFTESQGEIELTSGSGSFW